MTSTEMVTMEFFIDAGDHGIYRVERGGHDPDAIFIQVGRELIPGVTTQDPAGNDLFLTREHMHFWVRPLDRPSVSDAARRWHHYRDRQAPATIAQLAFRLNRLVADGRGDEIVPRGVLIACR